MEPRNALSTSLEYALFFGACIKQSMSEDCIEMDKDIEGQVVWERALIQNGGILILVLGLSLIGYVTLGRHLWGLSYLISNEK